MAAPSPARSRRASTHSRNVIGTVYQPNIQEIAAANPAFSSGQQVDVNNAPDGPPPPDRPPPPPPPPPPNSKTDILHLHLLHLRRRQRRTSRLTHHHSACGPGGPPPPPSLNDPNLDGAGGPNAPGLNFRTSSPAPAPVSGSGRRTSPGGQPAVVQTTASIRRNYRVSDMVTSTMAAARLGSDDGFDPSQLPGGPKADFNALPPPGGGTDEGFHPSQLPGGPRRTSTHAAAGWWYGRGLRPVAATGRANVGPPALNGDGSRGNCRGAQWRR